MKKMFSALLLAGVLATGAVACSSDDDDNDSPTTEASSDETTGGADDETQSEEVQEYCDAAQAFADEVNDDGITADLASEGQDLVARAAEASVGASTEDAERIQECSEIVSEALTNV